ncbi:hypothetical protein [Pseudomonas sp. 37 R 15]|uniref:hypothetical protein n=1 Tax=Pseudomonas sp. 37 R 15 TaxID=1844104 RepID=UPI000811E253|nr:hypothetical protein [Pseudomonas sp. 37 R 15]CRM40238.1 hypothetical protein [Pseudomonas sp. 37 R 15]
MNHNLKPGDLALIVGSSCAENIGKTVRLVEFVPVGGVPIVNGQAYGPRLHPTWVVETPGGEASLIVPRVSTGRLESVSVGACRESWLMPLRGDFTHEQQKAKEAV